jgi:transposase
LVWREDAGGGGDPIDRPRPHHAKTVKQFVEQHKHSLALYFIPPYSPELNPTEILTHAAGLVPTSPTSNHSALILGQLVVNGFLQLG